MRLEQLRQIVAIEKCKSISKAAKELYVGQPALSSSLNSLEKEIHVQIFQRTPQGVVPTEDGQKILELARRVISDCNLIMDYSKQNDPEHLTGTIKVCLAPAYSYLFFPILTKYKKCFPNVDFRLRISPMVKTRELIRRGECSMAIDFVPEKVMEEEKLIGINLMEHRIKLFAGPLNKFYHREQVSLEELRDENFIAFSKEYWKENNRNLKIRTKPVFIEDNASIRQILRISDYLAIMPDVYDKQDVSEYEGRPRMIPVEGISNPVFYGNLVYPGNRQLTLLEQHTVQFLKNMMIEVSM